MEERLGVGQIRALFRVKIYDIGFTLCFNVYFSRQLCRQKGLRNGIGWLIMNFTSKSTKGNL